MTFQHRKASTWKDKTAKQQPAYEDQASLDLVLEQLQHFPPLVYSSEIESLKQHWTQAAQGKAFLLQGGDCVESFDQCSSDSIQSAMDLLHSLTLILSWGLQKPVHPIGRIAGQYFKPRSNATESINGVDLPVFRGEGINSSLENPLLRKADPNRMLQAVQYAAMTLNYIRSQKENPSLGYFSDPQFFKNPSFPKLWADHGDLKAELEKALSFANLHQPSNLSSLPLFTSHEGLVLMFEQAMTREQKGRVYNLGAHTLWIGDRTRQLEGAHVAYFGGIENPIGIKVGPEADATELIEIARRLNPRNEFGKLSFITRLGLDSVRDKLPDLIRSVKAARLNLLWSCDPMHGNGRKLANGRKTRFFSDIAEELRLTMEIHRSQGSHLGGLHLELTGDDVSECLGGACEIKSSDLETGFKSKCDPRLNRWQALELAMLVASNFSQKTTHHQNAKVLQLV